MHQRDKKIQYNECIICFSPLLKDISLYHLIHKSTICTNCIKQFKVINTTISFYHYPLHILYEYNDFFRQLLYQYKGQYDYALKDVFLELYKDQLSTKYKTHIIAVAPSHQDDNQARGFAPIESIARTIFKNVFTGLYKSEKYKQSELSYEQRKTVRNKILIRNKEQLKGKKVLILDDVITSGETLKRCIELIKECEVLQIELMILATRQNLKELEERTK